MHARCFTAPPRLIEALRDQALFSIMDVMLNCQFESLPAANVSWTYVPLNQNSTPIELSPGNKYAITTRMAGSSQGYIDTFSALLIRSVDIGDAGEYICSGTNGVTDLLGVPSMGVATLYYETDSKYAQ